MSIFDNLSFNLIFSLIKSIGTILLLIDDIHTAVQDGRFLCKFTDTIQFTLYFLYFTSTSHSLPIPTFRKETL